MNDNLVRRIDFVRTLDGDTFVGRLHLAPPLRPRPLMEISVRVEGWSADELNTVEGPYMRDRFDALLRAATVITVRMKVMSFERIVAAVFLDGVLFAGLLAQELRLYRRGLQALRDAAR